MQKVFPQVTVNVNSSQRQFAEQLRETILIKISQQKRGYSANLLYLCARILST